MQHLELLRLDDAAEIQLLPLFRKAFQAALGHKAHTQG